MPHLEMNASLSMHSFDEIAQLWAQIRLLNSIDMKRDSSEFFLAGASDLELLQLEKCLGFQLPADLRTSYQIHRRVVEPWQCDFHHPEHIPLNLVSCKQQLLRTPAIKTSTGVKPPSFGEKLLPFASEHKVVYCVDSDPSDGGVVGQIVCVSFQKATAKVVANDFASFLRLGASALDKRIAKRKRDEKKASRMQSLQKPQPTDYGGEWKCWTDALQGWVDSMDSLLALQQAQDMKPQGQNEDAAPANYDQVLSSIERLNELEKHWLDCLLPLWREVRALNLRHGSEHAPHAFGVGLQFDQLEAVERRLGYPLPAPLRVQCLIHANVSSAWNNFSLGEFSMGGWESLGEECEFLNDTMRASNFHGLVTLFPGAQLPKFGRNLIPFGSNGGGVPVCYDLLPGKGGKVGQIVEVDFEGATCKVLATDLSSFLKQGVDWLSDCP